MPSGDFEAPESMEDFQIAVYKCEGPATRIRKALGESLLEVITHLTFEHDMGENFDAHTPSKPSQICIGLRDSEIIAVSANLKVILRRCQRYEQSCQE
jgi:hypothetical protein